MANGGHDDLTVEQTEGHDHRPILITGGAGFLGTNVAHRFLQSSSRVIIYDNLARDGVERNLAWLERNYGDLVQVEIGDVRNERAVRTLVRGVSKVFHFAAQVNARGTMNVLEAIRALPLPPQLIYTATNDEAGQRAIANARAFRIPAVGFHLSTVYGPHQFGDEEQAWLTHFLIQSISDLPVTIYGDGEQVRDILWVEDLVDAFLLATENMSRLAGRAFDIGGGKGNTVSLLELVDGIEEIQGQRPELRFADERSTDQRYYVPDIRKFSEASGWKPKSDWRKCIRQLYQWLIENGFAVPRVETDVARHRHPAMAYSG
jgi:CDP-paratose 2-epimerase